MQRALGSILVAMLVVLAGCAGGMSPLGPGGSSGGDGAGTVTMYISDQPNAIEDFEHLNVTITRVGFHRVDGDGTAENETGSGANESASAEENGTDADGNGTAESESDGDGGGEWVSHNVSNRTVDLTELRGANATQLDDFDVPGGEYDAVFVYVSEVNGTLKNGEQVRVKLPSGKLKLNKGFTMGANESVDFVFDITVAKAGKSGKYVLQPVVSESGTDVPIEDVGDGDDEREGDEGDDERKDGEKAERGSESALDASFVGNVTPGENATVEVTNNGSAVANATVTVNGETVGETDADGRLTFAVPDVKKVEVTVEADDSEAELELEFEPEPKGGDGQGNGAGQGNGTGQGNDG